MRCKNLSIIWVRILLAVSLMGRTESDKETGFFPKSANHNEIFSKKPGFWPPAQNLRTPTKKPGFFPNLRITTKYSRKNPVSGHPRTHSDKETGFFPNLRITTKYSRKNPVSGHPRTHSDKETGFFPNLRITTKYSRKNPVSGHPRKTYALRQRNRVFPQICGSQPSIQGKNPVSGHPRSPRRTPTKKPGFFPNLRITTKYSREKPGFWPPARKS
jgi:ribosomal protein L28